MAIKKDAGKADIGPKKQVKATFAECTAENPLKCKYHGIGALQKLVGDTLYKAGLGKVANICTKDGKGYKIQIPQEVNIPENAYSALSDALFDKGFSLDYKDIENNMTVFTAVRTDGGDFVTPKGEEELEDADTLSSADAPEKKQGETDDVDNLDGSHTNEPSDEEWKSAAQKMSEHPATKEFIDYVKGVAKDGKIYGEKVLPDVAEYLDNNLFNKLDADDPVKKMWDETKKGLLPQEPSEETPTDESAEPDLSEFEDLISAGIDEGIEPEKQVDEFADIIDAALDDGIVPEGEKEDGNPPISDDDIKALVALMGVNQSHFDSHDDLMDNYHSIIEKGVNANGNPLSDGQKKWWDSLISDVKDKGFDNPAAKQLLRTFGKDGVEDDSSSQPKELTTEDIVEAFLPAFDGDLENDEHYKSFYETVITTGNNPSGTELSAAQIGWFKDASYKAHKAGVDNYALELLDKMLIGKGVLTEDEVKEWGGNVKSTVSQKPTIDSLIADMQTVIDKIHSTGLNLTWDAKKGNALGKAFEDAVNANDIGAAQKALDNFKDYIHKLESGDEGTEVDGDSITAEDIKDFFKQCGIKKPSLLSDANLEATKEALETGKWQGKPLTNGNKKWYAALAKKVPGHKVANAIDAMLAADKKKPKPIKKGSAAAALIGALSGSSQTMAVEGLLKPLEHDESLFPQNITQAELDKALAAPSAKALGGASGDNATLITIGGKQFVCKKGSGSHSEHIHNEVVADQAYRAGGVRAPDCQEYVFEQKDKSGNVVSTTTYKLAEFIKGKSLKKYMESANDEQKKSIQRDLLQGFPLDVLFSNWDVIGSDRDNILVDDEGHAWRIDNGGSFSMAAQSNHKSMAWGLEHFKGKAGFENWEEKGGWDKREWIDDFRTMRLDAKNKGLFDGYSTADIFLSAGNINLGNAVDSIQDEGVRKALAKPLFEMKQMTMRALSADLGGIKNDFMLSAALDASYEASKKNFREMCIGDISFSSGGIGAKESDKGEISPYPVQKPDPPEDPAKKFASGAMLKNSEYTGTKVSDIILSAAKTINYHAGFVMTDAQGNKLGNGKSIPSPDYSPNSGNIAAFKKIDRDKLVELAKTSDSAKAVLDYYDSVATSMANGFKLPVQEVKITNIGEALPSGFKTQAEIDFEDHKGKVMAQYQAELKKYNEETLPQYNHDKKEWEKNEKAKLGTGKKSLEGNFYDIANEFMEAAYNTYGIAQNNGESIDFVELGKYQNKYGGGISGSTTSNDSWTPASSHIKILNLMMSGMSLDEIANMKDDDPLVNNGHYSGKKAKEWFLGEAQKMLSDPAQTQREMAAYAAFRGLQVLKLENENADVTLPSGDKVSWLDHGCHTVTLIRKEGFSNAKHNTVAPIVQKGGDSSCGFQSNGAIGEYPYAYDVPLWNLSYTYSDANHKGSKVDAYKGSEHEWVANLVGLTPFRVNSSTNASQNVNIMRNNPTIKKARDKRIARLAPFFTRMSDLKLIA